MGVAAHWPALLHVPVWPSVVVHGVPTAFGVFTHPEVWQEPMLHWSVRDTQSVVEYVHEHSEVHDPPEYKVFPEQ